MSAESWTPSLSSSVSSPYPAFSAPSSRHPSPSWSVLVSDIQPNRLWPQLSSSLIIPSLSRSGSSSSWHPSRSRSIHVAELNTMLVLLEHLSFTLSMNESPSSSRSSSRSWHPSASRSVERLPAVQLVWPLGHSLSDSSRSLKPSLSSSRSSPPSAHPSPSWSEFGVETKERGVENGQSKSLLSTIESLSSSSSHASPCASSS